MRAKSTSASMMTAPITTNGTNCGNPRTYARIAATSAWVSESTCSGYFSDLQKATRPFEKTAGFLAVPGGPDRPLTEKLPGIIDLTRRLHPRKVLKSRAIKYNITWEY
jgi:hypothetical protein